MEKELQNMCEMLILNNNVFKNVFKFNDNMIVGGAMIYTENELLADEKGLKKAREILKKEENIFSVFRGNMEIPIVALMSLEPDPQDFLDAIKAIYKEMNGRRWLDNQYAIIASIIIYYKVKPEDYISAIEKARMFFEKIKKAQGILSSDSDLLFATLLAVSNINVDILLLEEEENYALIKGKIFLAPNHDLSHILSLDMGAPGLKAQKFLDLRNLMKEEKLNFGNGVELCALAVMSLLDEENDDLFYLVYEVNNYLKNQKGFKGWSMSSHQRLMYTAMIVTKYLKPHDDLIDSMLLYISLYNAIAADTAAAAAAAA